MLVKITKIAEKLVKIKNRSVPSALTRIGAVLRPPVPNYIYSKVENNNAARIPSFTGLSRFNHLVWRLAGVQVAFGLEFGLKQTLFHYFTFIARLMLLGYLFY